uniref:FLZ-type domain-containing protein n=1 Tax=Meloidogyne hapla TaxID=6305 RepID=A0A1I8BMS4_MELHA
MHQKRWSCAVDMLNSNNSKNNFYHRPSALSADSSRLPSFDGYQLSSPDISFDPNDRQYLFCCGKCHSTIGVKVIAGYV